jgi:hypothetical protein
MRRICPPLGVGTEGFPKAAFSLASTTTSETATMHDDWMGQHHRTLYMNSRPPILILWLPFGTHGSASHTTAQ